MTEYGGGKQTWVDKVGMAMVILAMGLLFVVLTQPAWNSKKMIADFESSCAQRKGILIKHEKMFGTEYECSPDYSAGVQR